jgi:hypothetical protein
MSYPLNENFKLHVQAMKTSKTLVKNHPWFAMHVISNDDGTLGLVLK